MNATSCKLIRYFVLALPALLIVPAASPASITTTTSELDSEESAFLDLINQYRAEHGVGPLEISPTLQSSSKWMSGDMAKNSYASHTDSLGRGSHERILAFHYSYGTWGENIAAGFADAPTALREWENACDPDVSGKCTYGHRMNMLNPHFKVIGIARAYKAGSRYRGWYWTTDFGGEMERGVQVSTRSRTESGVSIIVSTPLTSSVTPPRQ